MEGNDSTKASHMWAFLNRRNSSWSDLLFLLPWVVGAIFVFSQASQERGIAQRQQTTYGTITAHEPSNHDRYGYAFSVSGKSYKGWYSPSHEYKTGQRVLVYYDPANPAKNALGSFAGDAASNFGFGQILIVGVVIIGFYIAFRRIRFERSH